MKTMKRGLSAIAGGAIVSVSVSLFTTLGLGEAAALWAATVVLLWRGGIKA